MMSHMEDVGAVLMLTDVMNAAPRLQRVVSLSPLLFLGTRARFPPTSSFIASPVS